MIGGWVLLTALLTAPVPPERPVPQAHIAVNPNPGLRPTPWPRLPTPVAAPEPVVAAPGASPDRSPPGFVTPYPVAATPQTAIAPPPPASPPLLQAPQTVARVAADPEPARPDQAQREQPQPDTTQPDPTKPEVAQSDPAQAPQAAPVPAARSMAPAEPRLAAIDPAAQPVVEPAPDATAPARAPSPVERPRRAAAGGVNLAALTPARDTPVRPSEPAQAPREADPVDDDPQLALNATPSDRFICQDPRLVGVAIPDIGSPGRGCGVLDPVRISAIGSIRLSTPAVVTCPTARQFANWVTGVANPAAKAQFGKPIASIWVMGSYACRNRNGLATGRLSEHAHGQAVDIGGITLVDGRSSTVLQGWGKGTEGAFWREVRRAACGGFQTVLGPGSDRFHANHLHFDTSLRGGAPYCR